jgi:hypothetical protein
MVSKGLQLFAVGCGILLAAGVVDSRAAPVPGGNGHPIESKDEATQTTWYVDAELIHLLEKEASRKVSAYIQAKGRLSVIDVKVSINMKDRMIIADIGKGFLPKPDEGEMFFQELAVTLRYLAEQTGLSIIGVDFHFQGKPLKHYYPEELAVPPRARASARNQSVLVSASHGLVRVHPSQRWEFQRPDAFGFREDMITPPYGDALAQLLQERSGLAVSRARSRSLELHSESSRPWEQMSSRYHLKALLPDRGDIWNSLPENTDSDREVKEDIRVRPLYANHLGVAGMISLHTNGHERSDVRGVEVFYHGDKPDDRPLAERVLCGMREVIRAQPGYENFPVRRDASPGRHGENRIGTMPSVLVEIAYHSNPDDSAALQDPVFREASMKGVEKGYRLFREGKDCTPLALRKIDRVTVPASGAAETDVHFDGNPQFPVTLIFTPAYCTQPGACRAEVKTVTEASASPIKARMTCEGSGYGMVNWSTVMRDADGVTSGPVEHWMTCQGGS